MNLEGEFRFSFWTGGVTKVLNGETGRRVNDSVSRDGNILDSEGFRECLKSYLRDENSSNTTKKVVLSHRFYDFDKFAIIVLA